jgi:O-antigen/teichoic acid export membrane protein
MFARMIRIAAPVWPGALMVTVLFSLDRMVLLNLVPLHELGIYSVALQFAAVITLLFTALSPPFEAWAYQSITVDRPGLRLLLVKRFAQIAAAAFITAGTAGPILMWFLPYWVAPEFAVAARLILPLMLAFTAFGLFRMMNVCLICLDRLTSSSALSALALVLNTGILVVLVPIYGIDGAAYGLLLGFGMATLIQFIVILMLLSPVRRA